MIKSNSWVAYYFFLSKLYYIPFLIQTLLHAMMKRQVMANVLGAYKEDSNLYFFFKSF